MNAENVDATKKLNFGLGGVVYGPVLMNIVPLIYQALNLGLRIYSASIAHFSCTYSSSVAHTYE